MAIPLKGATSGTGVDSDANGLFVNVKAGSLSFSGALPAGANVIGAVTQSGGPWSVSGTVGVSGSVAVTGTFFQATQPVSIAAAVAVTGTFFQVTQPVSGTITVGNVSIPVTQS